MELIPNPDLKVYTIGHGNQLLSQLIEQLIFHHIQLVVDVRSTPYSKFASQFNRETLQQTLIKSGIQYSFAGSTLGGRPTDPSCYKNGEMPEGKADYLHLVDYPVVIRKPFFIRGLNRLIELADGQVTCILCSEIDPNKCHRHHMIGKALVEQGVTVLHIIPNSSPVRDQALSTLSDPSTPEQLRLLL